MGLKYTSEELGHSGATWQQQCERLGPPAPTRTRKGGYKTGRGAAPRPQPPRPFRHPSGPAVAACVGVPQLRAPATFSSTARPENNPAADADADAAISLMNHKQGVSDEDAPRCPTPRGFVLGRCSLCGAMEEGAEGAASAVAVGHETLRQGGDGDGGGDGVGDSDDYAASCPPHPRFVHGLCSRCGAEKEEEEGGVAPLGVTVGHETMRQGGDRDGDYYAASCPPHPGFVHGVWEAAGRRCSPRSCRWVRGDESKKRRRGR